MIMVLVQCWVGFFFVGARKGRPDKDEGNPDMKVKLKSFLSGKWGAGSRRLSAQHFLTLKIDFNFPFTCNVWVGSFSLRAKRNKP